jgi:hypothetical protein
LKLREVKSLAPSYTANERGSQNLNRPFDVRAHDFTNKFDSPKRERERKRDREVLPRKEIACALNLSQFKLPP